MGLAIVVVSDLGIVKVRDLRKGCAFVCARATSHEIAVRHKIRVSKGEEKRGGEVEVRRTDGRIERVCARSFAAWPSLSLSLSHLFLFVLFHGERFLVVVRPRVTFDVALKTSPGEGRREKRSFLSQPRSPRLDVCGGGVGFLQRDILALAAAF